MSATATRQMLSGDGEQQSRSSNLIGVVAVIVTVVLASVGLILTMGSRLSAVETEVIQARERLQRVEGEASAARGYLQSIDQRLARIEGKLESRR